MPQQGVVDGLAELWIDHLHHRPDDLPRREELAAVVVLAPHLQQQPLVHLTQHEVVLGVERLGDVVDLVGGVEEVLLRVDPHPLDARQNLADDLLPLVGVRPVLEPAEIGQQFEVHKAEERPQRATLG